MQVLAVDPGRDKCGVALARFDPNEEPQVLLRAIWPRAEFFERLQVLLASHAIEAFVVGDATTSQALRAEIESKYLEVPVHVIDERNSTLEARDLYWHSNPPRGWRRLVPLSLQNPPRAVDDFAAEVLARRFARGGSL